MIVTVLQFLTNSEVPELKTWEVQTYYRTNVVRRKYCNIVIANS